MISSPYKQHWNKLRRLLHNNVFSPAHVALQISSHKASVNELINKLENEMKVRNGVVKPFYALNMMAMSFIDPLFFGPYFEDETFLSQLEGFIGEDIRLSKRGDMLLDFFPTAHFFVPPSIKIERNWKSLKVDVLGLMLPFIRFV
ncbi:hypothetical protein SUGI_0805450 [Cryptomeria japonica]|nr:hypothetical protein SUGI_0805450 [Cryptomeria japonica]